MLWAVFNEMERLGFYEVINSLKKIRQFKEMEREMGFLESYQIPILLEACEDSRNKQLTTVAKICLSTGSRFGEAEYLTRNELIGGDRPCLRFVNTKNGRVRAVLINQAMYNEIHAISNNKTDRRFFSHCRIAFRKAADRSGIEFPKGQKTHILRHTFASHFMMNGGDILTLQKVLGHSDLKMTLRYSHLSPDYLTKILELNPLVNCKVPERAKVIGLFDGLVL
jgi:integrase